MTLNGVDITRHVKEMTIHTESQSQYGPVSVFVEIEQPDGEGVDIIANQVTNEFPQSIGGPWHLHITAEPLDVRARYITP